MQLRVATKPTDANFVRVIRKMGKSIKVVTNDSIGACSLDYIVYILKLRAPPRAVLLVYVIYTCGFEPSETIDRSAWGHLVVLAFYMKGRHYEATQPLEADEQAAKRNKRETQS